MGCGGIALIIFNLSTRWALMFSLRLGRLVPEGKSRRYPLTRRLGGPESRSGRVEEEKNLFAPPEL